MLETFEGDVELIAYVQALLGICLSGAINEQIFPIFHGVGANGKSVLTDLLLTLLGEYATVAPPSLIIQTKYSEHPTEIADLRGRRLVIASETEEGGHLKLALIKRLTGDSRLKGRFMRADYFEFQRTHKLVMVTNYLPEVDDNSPAIWRRLRVVPFRRIVPPDQRDPHLLAKLLEEAPGILWWMVEGAARWYKDGLNACVAVEMATDAYRREADVIGRFIEENCEVDALRTDDTFRESLANLYEAYEEWCGSEGCKPKDKAGFGSELRRREFAPVQVREGERVYKARIGIRLKPGRQRTNAGGRAGGAGTNPPEFKDPARYFAGEEP